MRGSVRIAAVVIAAVLGGLRAAHGQRGLREIPAPDPVAELAALEVAEGYEASLFAADPLISKPLQMHFDTRGRLWVSSSSVYPQIRPGEVADDKVTVLEDTDGDGRADRATAFATGLLMPTGLLPDDAGGAYVANSTELLHLADTDGDGRADRREVVLAGFGAEDTHHIIHTFRHGPDARIYFNQSIYIHSHVETPRGVKRLGGGGIWRFRPERPAASPGSTFALDVFARGWVNPWGHAIDRFGRSFVTDGAGGEGIAHAFPGAAYQAAVGTPRILHGMSPGSPKYCGLEIIDGGHLAPEDRGEFVTADFRANRVCRFRLEEQGSGFTATKLPDLIRSRRVTFRPIDVRMGPDGAIYVADWYNPIIQHGEVDFRDERRDRTHGRIWRVTAKGRPPARRIDFTSCAPATLLDHLLSADGFVRDMARRELFARGPVVVLPELDRWLTTAGDAAAREPGSPEGRRSDFPHPEALVLEALRLRQGFDGGAAADIDRPLIERVLAAADPRIRAAGCRVVPDWADRLADATALLAPAVDDPALLVRLEGVRALAALGGRRAAELVLHAVDHDRDDALDYAVWLAARELRDDWLPAVLDPAAHGHFDDGGRLGRLAFAIRAAEAAAAIPRLVARIGDGLGTATERRAALDCIAALGDPATLRLVFTTAVAPATPPAEAAALLDRLVESSTRRRLKPAGDVSAVAGLLGGPLEPQAIAAAGAWQVAEAVGPLAAIARDSAAPRDRRSAAIAALGRIPAAGAREAVESLAADADPLIAAAAVTAIVPAEPELAARLAVPLLARPATPETAGSVFNAFLATKGAAARLAAAVAASPTPLPAAVAARGLEAVGSSGRREESLERALAAAMAPGARGDGGAAVSGRHAMNAAELETFAEMVGRADPRRGEALYRRESLRCTSCHRIGDSGPRVGPNLAAIGAASPLDYIIDSLVHPAKNVKENFASVVVLTADGRVVSGIPISRGDEELVLRDATDREVRIRMADIDEESPGSSLMPAGLIDSLSREELADLVRYLSGLGR